MAAFLHELKVAQLAVRRASSLTKSVSDSLRTATTVTKDDHSPVTAGDYGAQATIISAIRHAFPTDEVIGEEDSDVLRQNEPLRQKVFDLVVNTQNQDAYDSDIGKVNSIQEMLDAIDHGDSKGGKKGRFWALDPIDGTKGFLRGDQFAVCLALIVDAEVVLGVIGCPNLHSKLHDNTSQKGSLFYATKGQGSFQTPLFIDSSVPTSIHFNDIENPALARVCEGVEKGHSSHETQAAIKKQLGINLESVRLDSQVKYCAISRGDGDIYLRLPVTKEYREKIWDHASGNILVSEAGGIVSDMFGNPLYFGSGRTLNSQGIIAGPKKIHAEIIEAVEKVLSTSTSTSSSNI